MVRHPRLTRHDWQLHETGRGNARAAVGSGSPSVVRRAITLLLNHPEAADKLDVEKLAGVNGRVSNFCSDLIETVQEEPNITTAGLLERWRHHDEGRHLGKLAAVEVPEEEDFDPGAELAKPASTSWRLQGVGNVWIF